MTTKINKTKNVEVSFARCDRCKKHFTELVVVRHFERGPDEFSADGGSFTRGKFNTWFTHRCFHCIASSLDDPPHSIPPAELEGL